MGIDALDLGFRLEKKFGIKIPYPEGFGAFAGTAGMLHRLLVAKLNGETKQIPAIEPLYLDVCTAFSRALGRSRWGWWKVGLSNSMNRRFPPDKREALWQSFEKELGVPLPRLEYTPGGQFPTIPQQYETLLPLCYWIAEHHPERVKKWVTITCERKATMADRVWTDDEVWEGVRECIAEVLRVNPGEVTPDARLVEDLGMN